MDAGHDSYSLRSTTSCPMCLYNISTNVVAQVPRFKTNTDTPCTNPGICTMVYQSSPNRNDARSYFSQYFDKPLEALETFHNFHGPSPEPMQPPASIHHRWVPARMTSLRPQIGRACSGAQGKGQSERVTNAGNMRPQS